MLTWLVKRSPSLATRFVQREGEVLHIIPYAQENNPNRRKFRSDLRIVWKNDRVFVRQQMYNHNEGYYDVDEYPSRFFKWMYVQYLRELKECNPSYLAAMRQVRDILNTHYGYKIRVNFDV